MVKISAVIITFNEEKNIERCINSIKGIADEIIVLDSFSTDKTKQICHNHPVNFVEREWKGYSNSKNYANSLAQYDFILSIDADEAVSDNLKEEIISIKAQALSNEVFLVNRLTNFCGKWIKHCGWYPDKVIRIWKKDLAQWQGDIHEKLVFSDKVTRVQLKGHLLHYSFHTLEQHMNTINKFSTLSANKRFKRGKKTNMLKIAIKPFFKFITLYFIKLGFLDGYYGYVVCKNSAHSAFLKEVKLRELHRKNK